MGWSAVAAVVAIIGADQAERREDKAHEQAQRGRAEQRKAQAEQGAQNQAQRAAERRRQLREERVKRARMIQAGVNTGTDESSGLLGGTGGLATERGSNIGMNLSAGRAADAITGFNQAAMNFDGSASGNMNKSNQWGQVGNMFLNQAVSGAVNSYSPAGTAPQTTQQDNANWFNSGTQDFANK